ncbi:MAG TPA: M28 family peptidase [Candidatus Limnocylindria bacterium]|nr:M28 family peptidase [Candidatus Limnocylindria bacterium]
MSARLLAAVLLACATTAGAASPPVFDGAAALRHVERLVALGPRPAGSEASARARAYIIAELKKVGVTGEARPFRAETPQGAVRMANVVAVVKGRRPDVIMLAGHYDTKVFKEFRFVGANDGGSSTALLIELARQLAARPQEYTYWVVWFDGEEALESWTERDSLYGSRHLAAELRRTGQLPRAMLLVDMIGDRDLVIRREAASTPWLTDIVWASAARLGYGAHFHADAILVEDDHVPFLRAGVPATLLIDFDYPPWHTAEDTVDKVSARSLAVVGEVLLDALPAVEHYLSRSR